MKESFSKYLAILILLSLSTLILVSSRKVGNINTPDTAGTTDSKDNLSPVGAEQTGSSPESGATSRLKLVHDWLVAKSNPNYGGTQPADYSYDRGTYWNRILYSAFWEPDGTATESDVLSGKTFYSGSNNRVQKTGTLTPPTSPGAYYEQFVAYDDYRSYYGTDYQEEESTWTNTNALSGSEVWYDTRTGLYWARSEPATKTNSFTISSCDFYTKTPRGSYDGSDADCGNAINACGTLSLASTQGQSADTDWYLPSQKELQEAYADGIYNKTNAAFTTTSYFWSSTECSSGSSSAWYVYLRNGDTGYYGKGNGLATRCVRRD